MTFTSEDIKRLIPEAGLQDTIASWVNSHLPAHVKAARALLTTRRQLEIAMEALEKVKKIDRDGDLEWADSKYQPGEYWMEKWADQLNQCGKAADEALESIKKVGEA